MYRIKTFNKISPVGLNRLEPEHYTVSDAETQEDGILVRSAKLLDYDFPANLLAIARAGAGVNNIPLDRCSEQGIVVFNTPGANANAVKELVLCAMLMGSRDVPGAIDWVRKQVDAGVDVTTVVEKGKAAFVGPELYKKTLGVIGLGAIGSLVANIALSMGMDVYGYDPFLSVDAALRLDRHIRVVKDINELYKRSDYITVHTPVFYFGAGSDETDCQRHIKAFVIAGLDLLGQAIDAVSRADADGWRAAHLQLEDGVKKVLCRVQRQIDGTIGQLGLVDDDDAFAILAKLYVVDMRHLFDRIHETYLDSVGIDVGFSWASSMASSTTFVNSAFTRLAVSTTSAWVSC